MASAGSDGLAERLASLANTQALADIGGLDGVLKLTHSSRDAGLTDERVAANRVAFGVNKRPDKPARPFFDHLKDAFEDQTLRILLGAAVFEVVYALTLSDSKYTDMVQGAAILIAAVIVSGVNSYQNYNQDREFKSLAKFKEDYRVIVVRNGATVAVSAFEVVVGDVLQLSAGDRLPCDGVLISSNGLVVSQSNMTGESKSVHKDAEGDAIMIASSQVTEGGGRMVATAVGVRSSVGELLKEVEDEEPEPTPLQERLSALADQIGMGGMAAGVGTFAILTGLWLWRALVTEGVPFSSLLVSSSLAPLFRFFIVGVAIVIVAVPEGLPLAVTISLAFSMRRMMADKNYVRELQACETMGSATVIASDKTGTLTQNRMSVVSAWVAGHTFDAAALHSLPTVTGNEGVAQTLASAIALNTTAALHPTKASMEVVGNETEGALLLMLSGSPGLGNYEMERRQAPPLIARRAFDNRYKYMASLYAPHHQVTTTGTGAGAAAASSSSKASSSSSSSTSAASTIIGTGKRGEAMLYLKGAPEVVLGLCSGVQGSDGSTKPLDGSTRFNLEEQTRAMAKRGLRTLAVAYRRVGMETVPGKDATGKLKALRAAIESTPPQGPADAPARDTDDEEEEEAAAPAASKTTSSGGFVVERDLVLLGLFGIEDPLREGVTEALAACRSAGIRVLMVTGDHPLTATSIAQQCGILTPGGLVMEGPEFRALGEEERMEATRRLAVLARSSPKDKKLLVQALKACDEVVAVTGDGTNDAPALRAADVGLAMGIAGTEVAKEACDIVILDDNFASIVASVRWGRSIKENIRKFLTFQLTINIVALALTIVTAIMNGGDTETNFPITAVQLLWVNLIMDSFAALALATEPPNDRLLRYPPHGKSEALITRTMWKNIMMHAAFQLVVLLCLMYVPGAREAAFEWAPGTPYPNTPVFTTFVALQVFNLFNCRSVHDEWNIVADFSASVIGQAIVAIIVVMQFLIVTFGRDFMQTHPMTPAQWGRCVAIGALSLPVGYLLKLIPAADQQLRPAAHVAPAAPRGMLYGEAPAMRASLLAALASATAADPKASTDIAAAATAIAAAAAATPTSTGSDADDAGAGTPGAAAGGAAAGRRKSSSLRRSSSRAGGGGGAPGGGAAPLAESSTVDHLVAAGTTTATTAAAHGDATAAAAPAAAAAAVTTRAGKGAAAAAGAPAIPVVTALLPTASPASGGGKRGAGRRKAE